MITPGCYVELVTDAFMAQNLGHLVVAALAEIIFRRTQHNVHAVKFVVLCPRHKIGRVVEINVVVVIPTQKRPDVERCAHCEQVTDLFGMAEGEVQRVIPTKRRARNADFLNVTLALNARYEFFVQKFVVQNVVPDAGAGVQVFGVPAVFVDAANAV